MTLAELKNKRERFLLAIYELAEGEANREVNTEQIAELLRIDYGTEASKLGSYWLQKGMVKWHSFERIFLTSIGLDEAESILEAKGQPPSSNPPPDENISCPACRQNIRATAQFCEHCGVSLNKFNVTTLAGTNDDATTLVNQASLIGKVIESKYEILEHLGKGGGGAVYRARRLRIGDEVAFKVLHDELFAQPEFRDRFRREAMAAAKIHHPNIVAIHDFSDGEGNDAPGYLVMELVEGEFIGHAVET